jgi:L-threonylcarbamoyladenylate synthase
MSPLFSSPALAMGKAVARIRAGGLVAFPTETVYGLGANALDAAAVGGIYSLKQRPRTSPLIVHVASVEMARELAAGWPEAAAKLAAKFWPGPLTIVVAKRAVVPDIVTAGLPTVGLRMPAHAVALELIRQAGVPIAAPSANKFTQLSPVRTAHVRAAFGDQVMVLEGGAAQVGLESTVVSVVGAPTLLRPGMVSQSEIEAVIGPLQLAAEAGPGAHAAPGQHAQHYQPRTKLLLGPPPPAGRGCYLYHSRPAGGAVNLALPAEPKQYAAKLYDTLHEADRCGYDWMAVEPVPDGAEWAAIRDRLQRAAQKGVTL